MEEIMNNVEVMENEDTDVNEIVPVEAATYDEPSESDLSKKDMVIGGVVLGLATAGAVALGRCAYRGCKAVIKKIKDRATKKGPVDVPATAPIDEKPVEVNMPAMHDVEVVNVVDEE